MAKHIHQGWVASSDEILQPTSIIMAKTCADQWHRTSAGPSAMIYVILGNGSRTATQRRMIDDVLRETAARGSCRMSHQRGRRSRKSRWRSCGANMMCRRPMC
jgi:hypothetical protein